MEGGTGGGGGLDRWWWKVRQVEVEGGTGGGWDRLRDKLNAVIVRLYLLVLAGHCSDDVHQLGAGLQAVPGQGGSSHHQSPLSGQPYLEAILVLVLFKFTSFPSLSATSSSWTRI